MFDLDQDHAFAILYRNAGTQEWTLHWVYNEIETDRTVELLFRALQHCDPSVDGVAVWMLYEGELVQVLREELADPVRVYEENLRYLHWLEEDRTDETEEGDKIREALSDLWSQLSDNSKRRMDRLSILLRWERAPDPIMSDSDACDDRVLVLHREATSQEWRFHLAMKIDVEALSRTAERLWNWRDTGCDGMALWAVHYGEVVEKGKES